MADDPYDHLGSDPTLGPLVQRHGALDIGPVDDTFRRFTVAIINQQLSSESAAAIRDRVFEEFDVTPAEMAAADEKRLRETGLSRQKIEYIKNIAERYLERDLGVEYFAGMDDDAVIAELTDIKGVGDWTAKMYLIFCLGRPDVFPVEDLGIRKGMQTLFSDTMTEDEMMRAAEPWRPYRSYASRYVWRIND